MMNKIFINREPVELYKLLKFEALVASGGEAKMVIDEGLVNVNGALEMRKRRKMMSGDTFEFNAEHYCLVLETE